MIAGIDAALDTNLDGARWGDVVGKVAGVEVALEPTQRQDELRIFYLLLDNIFGDRTDVDLNGTTS